MNGFAPGKILIPGVISHATKDIVERRGTASLSIIRSRLAKIVSRENVIWEAPIAASRPARSRGRDASDHHVGEAQIVGSEGATDRDAGVVGQADGGIESVKRTTARRG